jgi:hypothetical protein
MSSNAHDMLDKTGEAATAVISNVAGAVMDPKTGLQMAKKKSRKVAPLAALFVVAVALVAWKLRQSSD